MSQPAWKSQLPPWREDSPAELYAMMLRYKRDELSEPERNLYAQLLTHVVAIQFNQHDWHKSLPHAGISPPDLMQETIAHLMRKTRTLKQHHPGWRPMMALLNGAIRWFVKTAIAGKEGKHGREISATDYFTDRRRPGELPAKPVVEKMGEVPLEELLGEAAEDDIIGDISTKSAGESAAVEAVYKLLRDDMIKRQVLPAHKDLPWHLKQEVSIELHALLVARILRFVRAHS